VIELKGGPTRLADPITGRLLPPLSAADASAEVQARWRGEGSIAAVARTSKDAPPLDLRRPIDAWLVRMSDGTYLYVDAASGQIVATRTRWWRFYDLMWGLHIMDLRGREDTHNPLLIGFASVSLLTVLLALVLLPLSTRRRRS
jgi:hypothetical protein